MSASGTKPTITGDGGMSASRGKADLTPTGSHFQSLTHSDHEGLLDRLLPGPVVISRRSWRPISRNVAYHPSTGTSQSTGGRHPRNSCYGLNHDVREGCPVVRIDVQADAHVRQRLTAKRQIGRGSLHKLLQRKSTIAFLMTLPLITLLVALVAYPAGYAIYLSMLDRSMTRFVGLANFALLVSRDGFWMVVYQTSLFAVTAVALKAIIGFVLAHLMHNIPTKGQRKWRGMLLVPWVIPPAMSVLALAVAVRSVLQRLQLDPPASGHGPHRLARRARLGALFGHPGDRVVRRAVLHGHVPRVVEVGARGALRGGVDRRRHLVAAHSAT